MNNENKKIFELESFFVLGCEQHLSRVIMKIERKYVRR